MKPKPVYALITDGTDITERKCLIREIRVIRGDSDLVAALPHWVIRGNSDWGCGAAALGSPWFIHVQRVLSHFVRVTLSFG
jgi:hypothetical protein